MTAAQMISEFKLLMDKADSPSFLDSEIYTFLNAAVERFISKRAFGNNPRRTGFDEDQKRRDDLRNIIAFTSSFLLTTVGDKPNSKVVALPNDYRHAINEEATITYVKNGNNISKRVGVKPITHDRYNKILDDPFNKPNKESVYRLEAGEDKIELIVGQGVTLSTYYLRYLKTPAAIALGVPCILADHTHREIVRMAVLEALENTENPRYQSSKIELNEIE